MLRALILLLLLPFAARAQSFPTPQSDTISDYANLLDAATEARLTASLQTLRADTGVQLVVVTMDHIADHGGENQTPERYAKGLFNAWGIGDKARNDGILFLIVKDDRVVRIALGRSYDAVYDGHASRAIETVILPAFRQGNYVAGIEAGIEAIKTRIVTPSISPTPPPVEPASAPLAWLIPALIGFVGVIGIGAIFRGHIAMLFRRCPSCNQRKLHGRRDVIVPARYGHTGEGIDRVWCSNCNYSHETKYIVAALMRDRNNSNRPGGGSSSGGGSSGFGGGSSSGGGATGRW